MNAGDIIIGAKINTKSVDAQIEYLQKELDDLEKSRKIKLELASKGYIELTDKEIKKLDSDIEKLSNKIKTLNNQKLSKIKKSFEEVGKGTENAVKKLGKMTLGIFAIESAYGMVRQAISTLSSENEQLGSDIENIRYGLSSALLPVIQTIIGWVYKLMQYVNAIAEAWTGNPIFSKKNVDNLKGANKEAKELKRSLSGFDEMNTVGSSGSSSSTSSGGGVTTQGFTLPEGQIPSWLQWIVDNKDSIVAGLGGIAGGLMAIKFGADLLMATGIGLIIAGLILAIKGVIDFAKDPSWNNFLTVLQGIALVVAGIALLMGGWVVALVALGVAIVAYVIQNWDKVKEILGKIGSWIWENVLSPIASFVGAIFDTILTIITNAIRVIGAIFDTVFDLITLPFRIGWETIKDVFDKIKQAIGNVAEGFKKLFSGDIKGALESFKNAFKNIFDALWSIAKAPLNLLIEGINALIRGLNSVSFKTPNWVPVIGGKEFGFNIPQIPKLAAGGIINLPGRGVPIGGYQAIGGEVSREGVIPLTDSQAMSELGEAIGRYITLNLTNVTTLDGRTIARQVNRINDSNGFATNR